MNVIVANYGNHSMALLQYIVELGQSQDCTVISIDTGWSAINWDKRVAQAEDYARAQGFTVVCLKSNPSFEKMVKGRREFPTTKFQWCAAILKGLPLLDWLDAHDEACEAQIILSSQREASVAFSDLEEFEEESEYYNERQVWYPLYAHSTSELKALVKRTGLEWLTHRSLECDPCVNCNSTDFKRLSPEAIKKTINLEKEINSTFFSIEMHKQTSIEEVVQHAKERTNSDEVTRFDMGCGSPYSCGQ